MEDFSYYGTYKNSVNKDNLLVENGFLNSWLFLYLNKVFNRRADDPIDFGTLYKMDKKLDSKEIVEKFESIVQKELKDKEDPSYLTCIFTLIWPVYINGAVMMAISFIL